MSPDLKTMARSVQRKSDANLARELSFARAFDLGDPDGRAWLAALEGEAARRPSMRDTGSEAA